MNCELNPLLLDWSERQGWSEWPERSDGRLLVGDMEYGFLIGENTDGFTLYSRGGRGSETVEIVSRSWDVIEKFALVYVGTADRERLGFSEMIVASDFPEDLPPSLKVIQDEEGSFLLDSSGKALAEFPKREPSTAAKLGSYVLNSLESIGASLSDPQGHPLFMTLDEKWERKGWARDQA